MKTECFRISSNKIEEYCENLFDANIEQCEVTASLAGKNVPELVKNLAIHDVTDLKNAINTYEDSVQRIDCHGFWGDEELNVSFCFDTRKILYLSENGDGKVFLNTLANV